MGIPGKRDIDVFGIKKNCAGRWLIASHWHPVKQRRITCWVLRAEPRTLPYGADKSS